MKEEEFIKKIYLQVRDVFHEFVSSKNWIWVDFFQNQTSGYSYFKETYFSDIDNISKLYKESNTEEDNIDDISDYIIQIKRIGIL